VIEGDHRGVVRHSAGDTEDRGMREVRDGVQARAFFGEHLVRDAAGGAVHAGVDLGHERSTGGVDVGEGGVLREQVRLGGDDVCFGEFDGVFHPAFRCRVRGLAGQHRDAVIPPERHYLSVADRDARDVAGGDGLLVVGEQVGRGAAEDPEHPVQAGEDTACGPVS
jgi:hypothetical protein